LNFYPQSHCEEDIMIRSIATASMLALTMSLPLQPAHAQDPIGGAIIGGAIGATVGGAATNRVGGAIVGGVIGAAAGAAIANEMQPRRHGYYAYQSRCWIRRDDGSYIRVSQRYCD
jgi:outer membrane lipoprotein SlyB